ncbi:hypothetical protein DPMN_020189 [Dreissena polymorpha]|uniref:Uncharacterized protein n=1 Tax=Dreissena polymorpha TaxID=45954 RepID=A0A9D4NJX7_DREPO|nr:hypothetical protein DPMN_020189 [Dreissena polymorpha]
MRGLLGLECYVLITKPDVFTLRTLFTIVGVICGCGTPHGCMDLLVFTTKSILPFCVSMDVLCSGCLQPSHYCLSVSTRMYCALCSQPSHNCLSVSAWMYCALCLQPSHYCLSVSAWIYLAPRVHNQVITAFLCQHGCIVFWVFTA